MEYGHREFDRMTPALLQRMEACGLLGAGDLWAALEQGNPAPKRYLLLERGEEWAFCVRYPLRLNLLTYAKLRLSWPVTLVALPCSVSAPGYHASTPQARAALFKRLSTLRGGVLVLNSEDCGEVPGFLRGRTLPTCVLAVRWASFEAYWNDLRSPYRRRLRLAREALPKLSVRTLAPGQFTLAHYALYEQVYQKSDFPLEKLTPVFFQTCPAHLVEFCVGDIPVGFVQLYRQEDTLWFFFCGMADDFPRRVDLYYVMLTEIVRLGIEWGCKTIDLGQTTEETKLRFGCTLMDKWFYARHSNPLAWRLLTMGRRLLEYGETPAEHHPFREVL